MEQNPFTLLFQKNQLLLAVVAVLTMAHSALANGDSYTDKLLGARVFPQQRLVWVGKTPPSDAESKELWEAFGVGHFKRFSDAVPGLETFIKNHPESPWLPSLQANLAVYYRETGYFTLALNNWQAAWESTHRMGEPKARTLADFTLVHWLQLLGSLGRTDTMRELFDETKGRRILDPFRTLYRQSQATYAIMIKHPDISYRCGTYALGAVAQALTGTNYFQQIWEQPSPQTGFSMASLLALSESNHLNITAVERPWGQDLVVPSVVHWKQNHYAAIVGKKDEYYKVVDPTFQMSRWLKADAINAECSGQFLVPANQVPEGWKVLTSTECAGIVGKGFPNPYLPEPCCPTGKCKGLVACGNSGPGSHGNGSNSGEGGGGGGGSSGCVTCNNGPPSVGVGGMPTWTVTEPWCDIWLGDEPLAYQPSKGPRISFQLSYNCNGDANWSFNLPTFQGTIFGVGWNWNCSWLSFIVPGDFYNSDPVPTNSVVLYAPGGGVRSYTSLDGSVPEFSTGTRMVTETDTNGNATGYRLLYPSGALDVYEYAWGWTNQPLGATFYFLSQQIDSHGNATRFIYGDDGFGGILLQQVVDGDGEITTLSYTNVGNAYGTNYDMISEITDPHGHAVKFTYDSAPYNDPSSAYYFQGQMMLTNITDVAGISTSFRYCDTYGDDSSFITNMITPYGTTGFQTSDAVGGSGVDGTGPNCPATLVTEPDDSHQMFFFGSENYPGSYGSANPETYTDPRYVPTNRPPDNAFGGNTLDNPDWNDPTTNDLMRPLNSFYWGREQFANLSAAFRASGPNYDISQLTTNDYLLGRMRHWNLMSGYQFVNGMQNNLSVEREPSPDGVTPGGMTWYDYPNKTLNFNEAGSSDTPILTIKVLPDGTEWYQLNQLDQWNNATNVITTYSVNGAVVTRTNSYMYATNGVDVLEEIRADGVTNAMYGYDTNHQVLFMTNALGEVTSYLYNGYEQPTSITQPNGQVTTNVYGADGYLAEEIVVSISTNFYTWTNGLVYTHTDERGLTVTNSWDALNRLTNVLYPDGTSMSYIYSNLDLVETIDRMGNKTYYTYDSLREKTSMKDARGDTTSYGYCQCGALYSITDALNNVTYFIHDNQGNLLQTIYPDGYSITNSFNLLHQLVSHTDSSGMTLSNWYNNQGLPTVSSNNVGLLRGLVYDVDDRVTNSTDANSVSVGMMYDNLNRLFARTYPDGGVESYGYTPDIRGPTSYTNQIGKVWLYGYDSLIRKTNEVCVGVTTNGFAYNGASDLLRLTDGNGNTTTWGYDQYGRVTNKVDAAGNVILKYGYDDDNRLTNRWTPAKGTTVYGYDAVGNLTNVMYPVSPGISLSYDGDNRLTSMVDGIGTTAYSYDQVGQLLSEGGLWPDDTVNYTYQNHLRMTLSLTHPSGYPWAEDYGYDDARRLIGVESSAGQFDYTYDPVKLLRVDELELPNDAYITNSFDSVARVLSTALVSSNGVDLDSQNYVYNTAGQRTNEVNAAGDYRGYTYDNEGELTAAVGKESGGANRLQEQFGYVYDAAGNLNFKTNNALIQTFSVNNLNELTADTNSGTLTVAGTTTVPATNVTVNGLTANHYGDATFALGGFTPTNGLNPFTAIASDANGNWSTNTSTANFTLTNNAYGYDLNGNLTNDGYKNFAYDDENELISVWVGNAWSNSFAYDGRMRRRIERDYSWEGAAWVETNEVHSIYDGNVVVEERNAYNAPQVSYTRGNDLSGTLQGAGGIGGFLARTTFGQELPGAPSVAFYHADGNGNITALIYPNQQLAAKYFYDPFGNALAMSGPLMNYNKYRFSSKEWNENSGLYHYLFRFYDPSLQRWLTRDPLNDVGFDKMQLPFSQNVRVACWISQFRPGNPFQIDGDNPITKVDSQGLVEEYSCAQLSDALYEAWYAGDIWAYTMIDQMMEDAGCFDPPPPPNKPNTCPELTPPPPNPRRFNRCAVAAGGIGIGIGIGACLEYGWPVLLAF